MPGSLIFVSGISGAGKSTLIRYAVQHSTNLIYLKTLTTRPPRENEDSEEYSFVANNKYEKARAESQEWDHTEYNGYKYGADVGFIKQRLAQGVDVICSVAPDLPVIQVMTKLYGTKPKLVWIDTPRRIAQERVAEDAKRSQRQEDDSVKQHFDHIFTPSGNLQTDRVSFLELIEAIS